MLFQLTQQVAEEKHWKLSLIGGRLALLFPQTIICMIYDSQTVVTLSDDCDRLPKMYKKKYL